MPLVVSGKPDTTWRHILLAGEPAWQRFVHEVDGFLAPERQDPRRRESPAAVESISARELEVLRRAADGLANDEIAAALGLSPRTVERHLSNAYAKLGVGGKAARAAAVAEVLRRGLA